MKYRQKKVLDNLAITIHENDGIVGLFGQNGVGKTTFLNVLSEEIRRFEGVVDKPKLEKIAFLPDKPFLYKWMTVSEAVLLFKNRYADFRENILADFLSGSQITPELKVGALSKGMSERLHLALIMAREPELYLLDEPLAAVDPYTREILIELIKKYRAPNTPLIISTHLIAGVEALFDTVIFIHDGKILSKDSCKNFKNGENIEDKFKEVMRNAARM
ncbi:MAG: ATP-binding cassette domain-containing protein [Culicoidibacterales bacterium]